MRRRIVLLIAVLGATIFMAFQAKDVKLSYEIARVVPDDDSDYVAYKEFIEVFGAGGNVMVVGVKNPNLQNSLFLNRWFQLADDLEKVDGVEKTVSIADVQILKKNRAAKSIEAERLFPKQFNSQKQADSLFSVFKTLPFYHNSFVNFEKKTSFIGVYIDSATLASKKRMALLDSVFANTEKQLGELGLQARYSGLPHIRTSIASLVKNEMEFFSLLSLGVCALILLLFFRSIGSVIFPIVVISIIVVWSLGTIALFDFKINAVTSLVPPLIIIIGVPNFIYLVNKFHNEFKKHGNKTLAIHRMIQKIGVVTLLTNVTTAIGFLVLSFTNSPVLKEFGLVAGLNILATFVVSIIVIPSFFSYLPEPKQKHTNYLESPIMTKIVAMIDRLVLHHRKAVFLVTGLLIIVASYGLTQLQAVGYVLDDMPKERQVYKDLKFFENNFGGVLPFEIVVDSKKPNGVNDLELLRQIAQFQDSLAEVDDLSKSIAISDLIKFTRQAYYGNAASRYGIPSKRERNFILPYLENSDSTNKLIDNLVDKKQQRARISANIADIGSTESLLLLNRLRGVADQVFDKTVEVSFTGVSLMFIKNNQYLIKSLIYSLFLAFLVISVLMGLLFKSGRMIVISLLPNFIPLLVTAGLMGYAGIALKPSTVLVFSIAFGISIDDALHFLAKYRQELKQHSWDIPTTISISLAETGRSMIYTSIVLFAGFSIFIMSDFGGTSALGLLTSLTLLVAMLTNLIVLPSLILSFFPDRKALV